MSLTTWSTTGWIKNSGNVPAEPISEINYTESSVIETNCTVTLRSLFMQALLNYPGRLLNCDVFRPLFDLINFDGYIHLFCARLWCTLFS